MEIRTTGGKATTTTRNTRNGARGEETESLATSTRGAKTTCKAGIVRQASAEAMLPPAISAKLSHISQVYALPVDYGKFSLKEATPENLKAMRKIADLMKANSKLLPEFFKLLKQVLNADIDLAKFHKNLTKAAIEHQGHIDRETAEIFLTMGRYRMKASKLEHRTDARSQLIDKRSEAYERLYQNSILGDEQRVIDVEFEIAASNSKLLAESKTRRLEFNKGRKEALQAYIDSAYTD